MLNRYRNLVLLSAVMLAQVVLLGYQIRRPDAKGVRLVRLWGMAMVTPVAKLSSRIVGGGHNLLRNYIFLRHEQQQNTELKEHLRALEIENAGLLEASASVQRLNTLLDFKQKFVGQTLAAQVIGGNETADSQLLYLNRGRRDGVKLGMPVITPQGVVGKVTEVLRGTATVLLVTDPDCGVGALLNTSGAQGIWFGIGPNRGELRYISKDEPVKAGEAIVTSGEDGIYPPGLPLGVVLWTQHTGNGFQKIRVRPAVDLSRVQEVLIVTQLAEQTAPPDQETENGLNLAMQKLPSVPPDIVNPKTGPPLPMEELIALRKQEALKEAQARAQGNPGATGAPASTAANHGVANNLVAKHSAGNRPEKNHPAANKAGTTQVAGNHSAEQRQAAGQQITKHQVMTHALKAQPASTHSAASHSGTAQPVAAHASRSHLPANAGTRTPAAAGNHAGSKHPPAAHSPAKTKPPASQPTKG